jgi:hypothetical protein
MTVFVQPGCGLNTRNNSELAEAKIETYGYRFPRDTT